MVATGTLTFAVPLPPEKCLALSRLRRMTNPAAPPASVDPVKAAAPSVGVAMPSAKSTYGGNGGRGLEVSGPTDGATVAVLGGAEGAAAAEPKAATVPLLTETGGNLISGLSPILLDAAPLLPELDCVVRGVGATPSTPAATRGAKSASAVTVESPGRVPLNQASIAAATSERT